MKNYTIRTEQPRDFKTVENLTREGTSPTLCRNSRSCWKWTAKSSGT